MDGRRGGRSRAPGTETLRRIARALDVPISAFHGPAPAGDRGDAIAVEAAALLGLVRAYLDRVPAADRLAFAAAVRNLAVKL